MALGSGGLRSIQLSYGRTLIHLILAYQMLDSLFQSSSVISNMGNISPMASMVRVCDHIDAYFGLSHTLCLNVFARYSSLFMLGSPDWVP